MNHHHNILELTNNTFPNLLYCEILDKRKTKEFKPLTLISPWINWLSKKENEFEWLRVKISADQQMIIRHIDSSNYLIVVNEAESMPLLISFIKGINLVSASIEETSTSSERVIPLEKASEMDLQMLDAVRIQKLIIPQDELIRKKFQNFFVVHKQQEAVGGDFYWYKEVDDHVMLALIDCTGHGIEGAMTSMVCNSLLNQVGDSYNGSNLVDFVSDFYELLSQYDQAPGNHLLDYGIGAEIGVFDFNYKKKEISFASTGISAFVKKKEGIELLRIRKVKDFNNVKPSLKEIKLTMDEVVGLYTFTDGLTDQYDSSDRKKLGYNGVLDLIEKEENFDNKYYTNKISSWMGENMQYDDITLLGIAI